MGEAGGPHQDAPSSLPRPACPVQPASRSRRVAHPAPPSPPPARQWQPGNSPSPWTRAFCAGHLGRLRKGAGHPGLDFPHIHPQGASGSRPVFAQGRSWHSGTGLEVAKGARPGTSSHICTLVLLSRAGQQAPCVWGSATLSTNTPSSAKDRACTQWGPSKFVE